ncbi:MAG: hypothetical protein ACRENJ_09935 [Candidatus Eiseniibacteriota bacterium]
MRPDHNPGGIIEGPTTEPAAALNGDAAPAGLPPELGPMYLGYVSQFEVPVFSNVRVEFSRRLARMILDRPPAKQLEVLTGVLYHLGLRGARR